MWCGKIIAYNNVGNAATSDKLLGGLHGANEESTLEELKTNDSKLQKIARKKKRTILGEFSRFFRGPMFNFDRRKNNEQLKMNKSLNIIWNFPLQFEIFVFHTLLVHFHVVVGAVVDDDLRLQIQN